MSDRPGPERTLDVVAKRREVLAAVADGAAHVRDLRDELDVSRSTAYEATRELERAGVLTRGDGSFELTPFGRSAVAAHDRSLAALDTLCAVRPELDGLRRDVSLPPVLCRGAEVVRAEPHAPDRPFEAIGDFFDCATRMRGFAPVTGERYIAGLDEALAGDAFSIEMLTEECVVEYLLSNHRDALDRWVDSDDVRLYQTGETLPYGLLIEEEPAPSVGVMLYDESGQLRAFLATEDRAAVGRARERFEARRATATELVGDAPVDG
ncbi:MAG: helix-turn-helix transcriptional regulator [Haloferacaceae archaeon]